MKTARIIDKDHIEQLEHVLRATLKSVSPRVGFVADLKQRLEDEYQPVITYPKKNLSRLVLLAAASIFSGVFLALNGARVVLSFLAAFGFWREVRKQANHKRLATVRPVI